MSRSKSIVWKADRIFHRCNPEWDDATDENPWLEDSEYDPPRCDAAGCMDVDVTIRGTSHPGNISGPADNWEEPSCDVDDAEFCVGWQRDDGIYHAEEFSSAREFAKKHLPENLRDDFEKFCTNLAESALDSEPETD